MANILEETIKNTMVKGTVVSMKHKRIIRWILLIIVIAIPYLIYNDPLVKTIDQTNILQAGFDLKSSIFIALGLGASFGTYGLNTDLKEKNSPNKDKKAIKKK